MATRTERLALYAEQAYRIYEGDILAAGNLEPAVCGNEEGGFWGTLGGRKLYLQHVKSDYRLQNAFVKRYAKILSYSAVAEVALIAVSFIFKLSKTPALILGAVVVISLAFQVRAIMAIKPIFMQMLALRAQERIHEGRIPKVQLPAGREIPRTTFDPRNADARRQHAQVILDILRGPRHLADLMAKGQGPTVQYLRPTLAPLVGLRVEGAQVTLASSEQQ